MIMIMIIAYCGAVVGTTILITAVPLSTAAAAAAAATAAASVFGWCAVLGGLCNPFSLFTLFLFFPPLGGSIIQPTLDKE
jgi:uncharacterized membrane protein YdcZ (DUF606 family)